jgi:PAB1-binding protein PBP1
MNITKEKLSSGECEESEELKMKGRTNEENKHNIIETKYGPSPVWVNDLEEIRL